MVKTSKFKSVIVVVARIVAFLSISCLLYFQLRNKDISIEQVTIVHFWPLILMILLTPVNWFLEHQKWRVILSKLGEQNNPNRKTAFYAGMVTGLLTPATAGNFIGRIYYFDKAKRWKLTIYTVIANFAQFVASLIFGGLAFVFLSYQMVLKTHTVQFIVVGCLIVFSLLIYLFGEKWLCFIPIRRLKLMAVLLKRGPSRSMLLTLSFLRYFIFLIQFSLCLYAFSGIFHSALLAWISLVFIAVTLTPSLFLGKIVVRESIAIAILSLAGLTALPILLTSLTTWFFNLILPTLWAALKLRTK